MSSTTGAPPTTPAEYWDKYRPHKGEGPQVRPAAERFDWTGVPGAPGPDVTLFGEPLPAAALDLGPAEGENAAVLARAGVRVTAVDFSAVQVARARGFWADLPNLEFVHAEALAWLDEQTGAGRRWELVYSTWGAVWFTDPEELLPRVARALAPGGFFAFSHREPAVGHHGARRMSGAWLAGRESELTVLRWQHTAQEWSDLLKRHGFRDVDARVLPAAEAGALGTLLVTARA
ncbi:class I SAM-dependent methyltransferase [Streptomyces sp. BI20]|uniref:class I SAM-dependent methyltransferase n=1 Tax=Streptomyces sp. BI20 TaxID=3403460 RepID=UPI003C70AFF2